MKKILLIIGCISLSFGMINSEDPRMPLWRLYKCREILANPPPLCAATNSDTFCSTTKYKGFGNNDNAIKKETLSDIREKNRHIEYKIKQAYHFCCLDEYETLQAKFLMIPSHERTSIKSMPEKIKFEMAKKHIIDNFISVPMCEPLITDINKEAMSMPPQEFNDEFNRLKTLYGNKNNPNIVLKQTVNKLKEAGKKGLVGVATAGYIGIQACSIF